MHKLQPIPCRKAFFALSILLLAGSALAQVEINWFSSDGGGGISSAGGLHLVGVIGQSDTIRMAAENLSLSGGYLPLPAADGFIFMDGFE